MSRRITKQKIGKDTYEFKDGELYRNTGNALVKVEKSPDFENKYFNNRYKKRSFLKKSFKVKNQVLSSEDKEVSKFGENNVVKDKSIIKTGYKYKDIMDSNEYKDSVEPEYYHNEQRVYRTLYEGEEAQFAVARKICKDIIEIATKEMFKKDEERKFNYMLNKNFSDKINIDKNENYFEVNKINDFYNKIGDLYDDDFYKEEGISKNKKIGLIKFKLSSKFTKTTQIFSKITDQLVDDHFNGLDEIKINKYQKLYKEVTYELVTGMKLYEENSTVNGKRMIQSSLNQKRNVKRKDLKLEIYKNYNDTYKKRFEDLVEIYNIDGLIEKINKRESYSFISLKEEINGHYEKSFKDYDFSKEIPDNNETTEGKVLDVYDQVMIKYIHDMVKSRYRKLKKHQEEKDYSKIKITSSNNENLYFTGLKEKILTRFEKHLLQVSLEEQRKNIFFDENTELTTIQKHLIKCENTLRLKLTNVSSEVFNSYFRNAENDIIYTVFLKNYFANGKNKREFEIYRDIFNECEHLKIYTENDERKVILLYSIQNLRNHIYHYQENSISILQKNDLYNDYYEELNVYDKKLQVHLSEIKKDNLKSQIEGNALYLLSDKNFKEVLEIFKNYYLYNEKTVNTSYLPRFSKIFRLTHPEINEERTEEQQVQFFFESLLYKTEFIDFIQHKDNIKEALKTNDIDKELETIVSYFKTYDLQDIQRKYISILDGDEVKIRTMNNKYIEIYKILFQNYVKNKNISINKNLIRNIDQTNIIDKVKFNEENKVVNRKREDKLSHCMDQIDQIDDKNAGKLSICFDNQLFTDIYFNAIFLSNKKLSQLVADFKKYLQFHSSLNRKFGEEYVDERNKIFKKFNLINNEVEYNFESFEKELRTLIIILENILFYNRQVEDDIDISKVIDKYVQQENRKECKITEYIIDDNTYFFPIKRINDSDNSQQFNQSKIISEMYNNGELDYMMAKHNKANLDVEKLVKIYKIFDAKVNIIDVSDIKKYIKEINENLNDKYKIKNSSIKLGCIYNLNTKLNSEKKFIDHLNKINRELYKKMKGKKKNNVDDYKLAMKLVAELLNLFRFVNEFKNFKLLKEGEYFSDSVINHITANLRYMEYQTILYKKLKGNKLKGKKDKDKISVDLFNRVGNFRDYIAHKEHFKNPNSDKGIKGMYDDFKKYAEMDLRRSKELNKVFNNILLKNMIHQNEDGTYTPLMHSQYDYELISQIKVDYLLNYIGVSNECN